MTAAPVTDASSRKDRIAVVGLGYVGLAAAVAIAKHFPGTVGFDIQRAKVEQLRDGVDVTGEVPTEELRSADIQFTCDPSELSSANFIIVAVPTPVDASNRPDLSPLEAASRTVGEHLQPGTIVVFESTVYPGVTEDVCGPILESVSGLKAGEDFKLGYSPERINPGDPEHRFETITKVVSGEDAETLDRVAEVYGRVIHAGVHRASSIRVAEASKVIENIQRDLNIALMNELAVIFDRLDIDTKDVLEAAGTKWNFLRFHPGLVGGHCIGVDPYYLTTKAEEVGITPQVILAGRRINNSIGPFVAERTIKELVKSGQPVAGARVAILGLTFKENVPDLRNSKVPDIIAELRDYGINPLVHDPVCDRHDARAEYDEVLASAGELLDPKRKLAAVVLAVPHAGLDELTIQLAAAHGCVVIDVRSVLDRERLPENCRLWRL